MSDAIRGCMVSRSAAGKRVCPLPACLNAHPTHNYLGSAKYVEPFLTERRKLVGTLLARWMRPLVGHPSIVGPFVSRFLPRGVEAGISPSRGNCVRWGTKRIAVSTHSGVVPPSYHIVRSWLCELRLGGHIVDAARRSCDGRSMPWKYVEDQRGPLFCTKVAGRVRAAPCQRFIFVCGNVRISWRRQWVGRTRRRWDTAWRTSQVLLGGRQPSGGLGGPLRR